MRALIVILMSPLVLVFLLSAIQTIEYNIDHSIRVPLLAYALIFVVAVWCVIAVKVSRNDASKAIERLELWFDNFLKK